VPPHELVRVGWLGEKFIRFAHGQISCGGAYNDASLRECAGSTYKMTAARQLHPVVGGALFVHIRPLIDSLDPSTGLTSGSYGSGVHDPCGRSGRSRMLRPTPAMVNGESRKSGERIAIVRFVSWVPSASPARSGAWPEIPRLYDGSVSYRLKLPSDPTRPSTGQLGYSDEEVLMASFCLSPAETSIRHFIVRSCLANILPFSGGREREQSDRRARPSATAG